MAGGDPGLVFAVRKGLSAKFVIGLVTFLN